MPNDVNHHRLDLDREAAKLQNKPLILPMGLVPLRHLEVYRRALIDCGLKPDHVYPAYFEDKFWASVRAMHDFREAGGRGLYLMHGPETVNHELGAEHLFRRMRDSDSLTKLWIVTKGETYTHKKDGDDVKVRIDDPNHDGIKVALQEGEKLGLPTVVLEKANLQSQIMRVLAAVINEEKLPFLT